MGNEERWMKHYEELKAYVEEHHHFPVRHTTLNNWIRYVRKKIKAGTLPEELKRLFEELAASLKLLPMAINTEYVYSYVFIRSLARTSRVKWTCENQQEEFSSMFNILDALGFWQDKVKDGSSMNRMNRIYDANHAYYASACDYFVTDNRNTRNKAILTRPDR